VKKSEHYTTIKEKKEIFTTITTKKEHNDAVCGFHHLESGLATYPLSGSSLFTAELRSFPIFSFPELLCSLLLLPED
jgi:hypothetical protein